MHMTAETEEQSYDYQSDRCGYSHSSSQGATAAATELSRVLVPQHSRITKANKNHQLVQSTTYAPQRFYTHQQGPPITSLPSET